MEQRQNGLYQESFEHDACGIGAVINIKGKKSHKVVDDALKIVEKLEHRAGKDATGKVGDGVGIMLQISHPFFEKIAREKGVSIGGEREYGVGMFLDVYKRQDMDSMRKKDRPLGLAQGRRYVGSLAW